MRLVCLPCGSWFTLVVVLLAHGAASQGQVTPPPGEWVKAVDLTNYYRFVEHYPREDDRELPGSLPPYRVGLVEVLKEVIDQPQGAPRRAASTRRTVYVERTNEQASVGGVIGSVRFVESFDLQPADPTRTMGPNPLDGLAVSLRYRATDAPIVVPTADRQPTDYEFEVITHQMLVPLLSQLLPPRPVRVGDTWQVPRRGGAALLGDPLVRGDLLIGKFVELLKESDGPRRAAKFGVSGRVTTSIGDAGVNAEVTFTFQSDTPPAAETGDVPASRPPEGLIEARGGITEVRLARTTTGPLPGPGRLKFQSTREVTLERRLDIGDAGATLPRLPAASKLDDPTTWLTWIDPGKRFRIDHPQDLLPPERPALAPVEPNAAVLVRTRRDGVDMIQADFVGKTLTIDDLKAKLAAKTGLTRFPVLKGEEGYLPEEEWPIGKVYRIEAAVQVPPGVAPPGGSSRIHFDAFLIQPGQAAGILVIATTSREPIAPFRREVERILKTIQIDPATPDAGK